MLFNSYEFILAFLPLVLLLSFMTGRRWGREASAVVLVLASLFFYGWWNIFCLLLILGSIGFNFIVGRLLRREGERRKIVLVFGIVCNLGSIAYFKYANFYVDNLNHVTGGGVELAPIVLPLAISFFTFQQIAYLVDVYRRRAGQYGLIDYALFVTFFPQLIAGPIVHHSEMMPQFKRLETSRSPAADMVANMAVGITIFSIGLFKKAVLADGIAAYATPVFDDAGSGAALTFFEAWGGALAYTLQLYFDFSGYSDMAIGAARLFGIKLPLNFFSPYKAANITEFWRRWHITLSRFLRDYLYIPLGGNRRGPGRRYANLMMTMLLGGLWHGAGWTFVIWGGLHGFFLVVHQAWIRFSGRCLSPRWRRNPIGKAMAWALTFLAVIVGWVFFRAADVDAALSMLEGMAGLNGIALPNAMVARLAPGMSDLLLRLGVERSMSGGAQFIWTYLWIAVLLGLALIAPNTNQIMHAFERAGDQFAADPRQAIEPFRELAQKMTWRPGVSSAFPVAIASVLGLLALSNVSEFLYFQF